MMNLGYMTYKWLTCAAAPIVVPMIWLHHRFHGDDFSRFYQRLGIYPNALLKTKRNRSRIWLHAVSVGEIGVAAPIIHALTKQVPNCEIVLSTMKEQALSRAIGQFKDRFPCFFAPLDILGPTRRALEFVNPDALVCLETEIWPNLMVGARRLGVPTAIVNGRISVRTVNAYRKFPLLMQDTLSGVGAFSMISSQDARRIESMGAPVKRIEINGNAKFDLPDPTNQGNTKGEVMKLLGVTQDSKVIVAGSTRHAEEPILLNAFDLIRKDFPDSLMIIAPRHIERSGQIARWADSRGFNVQMRSEINPPSKPRTAPVLILDTMGELSDIYSVASSVFCGGSLVPKGGQNLLEAAVWAKPTLFGPSMEDFADAVHIVRRAGGGVEVTCAEEIASVIVQWLKAPTQAAAAGLGARKAVLAHRGAATKHAAVIAGLLR